MYLCLDLFAFAPSLGFVGMICMCKVSLHNQQGRVLCDRESEHDPLMGLPTFGGMVPLNRRLSFFL